MEQGVTPTGLARYLPILGWLPGYPSAWLRGDLVAGLTTAAVVIPQAMAYAAIAGLPVEAGLYTATVPMLFYALLGTSRPLSVSTTSTISILTAAGMTTVVQSSNPADYVAAAATLALLAGGFLLLARILRMGFLANFISIPVLTGFKAGIGLVIFVSQFGKVLGIPVEKGPFFQSVLAVLQGLNATHWPTLLVALSTLAILLLLPRLAPRVPAPLAAVAAGILASGLLHLEGWGVALVGAIPPGLPSFTLPDLALAGVLWPTALGIALMSFTESIASARAFSRHGDGPVDANQELAALGVANIAGGLFQAYPAGGGTSQTAVNDQAGAKTQLAGLVVVGAVVVTLLFLAPLISLMPQATLGAIVLVVAVGLVKPEEFRAIGRIHWHELGWAIVALAGVLVLGTLKGILVAASVSLLDLLYQANHPPVYTLGRKPGTDVFRPLEDHPDDETFHGLLMVRTEGRMHFASAPRVGEKMWALIRKAQPRVLVLDCSAIPGIEYTALQALSEFEEKLQEQDVTLWLAGLNPEPLETIRRSPLGATFGDERMLFNVEQAVEAYQAAELE